MATLTKDQIKTIALKMMSAEYSMAEIGEDFNVTRERIRQIVFQLRKLGVKIPREEKKNLTLAVEELRVERPDIFF